jgi:hypothetical protein
MWHRLVSLKLSLDLGVLLRAMRKRGRLTVWLPPLGKGRVSAISFTLRTMKPRSCKPLEMSSVGVSPSLITALIGFSDFR